MTDTGGAEQVRYDVIIDAKASLDALKQLLRSTESSDAKIKEFTNTIVLAAKKWGVSWSYALNVYKQLNAELSKQHKQTIFGNVGGQNLMAASEQYLKAADSAGRLGAATATVTENTEKTSQSMKNAEGSSGRFRRSIDALRIAMGTLVAMAVFRFFNFIGESLRKLLDGAKQVELAFYQLANAEKALSEAGIEIAPKDFEAMIKSLKELFPYLSKIDLTRMVSQVALLTKDLGLTREQVEGLVKAIPIMAQRGQVTIEQATQQVVNGLANNGRGWKDLGIVVDAAVIKQEAVTAGLVESADAYNRLTAEQKQQTDVLALLSILNKSVSGEQKNQAKYQETLAETSQEATAKWEDFLATLGKLAAPAIIQFLQLVIDQLTRMNDWLIKNQENVTKLVAFMSGLVAAQRALNDAKQNEGIFDKILGVIAPAIEQVRRMGRMGGSGFAEEFMKGYEDAMKRAGSSMLGPDTPTSGKLTITPEVDTTKAQQEVEDLLKDLEQLDKKEIKITAEFYEKQTREAIDHGIDMKRAEQDYQVKRTRFIEDSNADIAAKNRAYHQKQLEDEAKFQEQLRQLRERFLFDLEDALRERDAKSVIRLQEKYRMDKEAMINEHNISQQAAAQQHAEEIAQAKRDRDEKLRQMDEDHRLDMQRKEEDYALKRAREQEDFQQELADLKAQREARMQEAANAIAEELGIKGQGVEAIYNMLNDFYGPGGAFDGLYDYTNRSMVARASQMLAQLQAIYAQAQALSAMPVVRPVPLQPIDYSDRHPAQPMNIPHAQAFGGSYLAMGPTKTTFGEQGPELATFIPLGRGGMRLPQGGGNGSNGVGGNVKIELMLSPDLESRIVENSMNATAEVVVRTINSKG